MNKNKILNSLIIRLPGGYLFNKLLISFGYLLFFRSTIEDLYIFRAYFLGSKKAWELYKKGLENKYFVKEKGIFDFGIMQIPKTPAYEKGREIFWTVFADIIYPEIFKRNSFFSGEGPYFYKKIQVEKGDIVIDAGANFGLFSALAASKGAKKVYAFEPVEWIRERNLKYVTFLYPEIEVIPFALFDKKGLSEMLITMDPSIMGASTLVEDPLINPRIREFKEDQIKKEKIQTISLDEWVEENKIPRIDFIKADIEGAERLLLKGAKKVLKEFAPKLSICAYHLKDDKEILPKLILEANPKYKIVLKWGKLYAYV